MPCAGRCATVAALDRAAIDATADEWRAAYLGEPTPVAPVIEALLLHLGRHGAGWGTPPTAEASSATPRSL